MCPYLLLKRASPQRTGNKKCKKRHWDSCHLQGLPGLIWREDSFSAGGKMVRELHVEHHSLNFLLKNYISKKIFQHIVGTGRSRGAFCHSFCSSGTSVTWEKVAKRGVFP